MNDLVPSINPIIILYANDTTEIVKIVKAINLIDMIDLTENTMIELSRWFDVEQ